MQKQYRYNSILFGDCLSGEGPRSERGLVEPRDLGRQILRRRDIRRRQARQVLLLGPPDRTRPDQELFRQRPVLRLAQEAQQPPPVPQRFGTDRLVGHHKETALKMRATKVQRPAVGRRPVAQLPRRGLRLILRQAVEMRPVPQLLHVVAERHVEPVAHDVDVAQPRQVPHQRGQEDMGVRLFPAPAVAPRPRAVQERVEIRHLRAAAPAAVRRQIPPQTVQELRPGRARRAAETCGHCPPEQCGGQLELLGPRSAARPVDALEQHREPQVVERAVEPGPDVAAAQLQHPGNDTGAAPPQPADRHRRGKRRRGVSIRRHPGAPVRRGTARLAPRHRARPAARAPLRGCPQEVTPGRKQLDRPVLQKSGVHYRPWRTPSLRCRLVSQPQSK
ncbi:hypothetical protein SDC9_21414 [bioreactor metagenome]|uniref:Uncharacterized protein n=1 Tax=bioreactor metagenome TaxID=1076179 RepID=A0A644U9G9_9ZZZZ